MLELINATVIFVFGFLITGIVGVGVIHAQDHAVRGATLWALSFATMSLSAVLWFTQG
jgi:lipid-binding SYLF domain-containing protein